jgi:hypothetical protein
MDGECSMKLDEESIWDIGKKSRKKETSRKTKIRGGWIILRWIF